MRSTGLVAFLALIAPVCISKRLGDDASSTSTAAVDLPKEKLKKLTKGLIKHFGDSKKFSPDRDVLAKIRETEMSGGASGSKRKYDYLGAECLFGRSKWAAKQFKEHGCKRILEVGGYSSPLPKVVDKSDLPEDLELYADVDPSSNQTTIEDFSSKFQSITFQLVLDEFRMNGKPIGKVFDCFLMLGTTAQNVGTDDKKKALQDALERAKLAILEYPSSNPDTPGLMTPPVEAAGLKKSTTHTVDCSEDKEADEKKDPECGEGNACLKRNIVVYKRSK